MKKEPILTMARELHTPADEGQNNQSNMIYLVNASRLTDTTFSEPLTAYAQGWTDPNDLRIELSRIAPDVPVARRFEFKSTDNSSDFLTEIDDVRGIDAPFKRVQYRGATVNERTYNKGLTIRLDKDGEGAVPGAETRAIDRLLSRLWRNEIMRATVLLVAAANSSNKTWNASSDPDGDLLNLVDASGDKIGIDPNKLLMGRKAWIKRVLALRASDKKGAENATLTPEQLASWLGIDEIITLTARRAVTTDSKTAILGNKVIAFFAQNGVSQDDPSSIKRFVSQVDAEAPVRVHREDYPKYVDISVEHYSNIVITSTLGIEALNIA